MVKDFQIGDWVYAGDWCYGQIYGIDDDYVYVEYETSGGGGSFRFTFDEVGHAEAPVEQSNFTEALSAALSRVGSLKGVIALDEDEIGIAGGHMNDYLLVSYLAQLFENGEAELRVRSSKCEYLFKLLHLREDAKDV